MAVARKNPPTLGTRKPKAAPRLTAPTRSIARRISNHSNPVSATLVSNSTSKIQMFYRTTFFITSTMTFVLLLKMTMCAPITARW